jgi:DNA replication and repair protein RecF
MPIEHLEIQHLRNIASARIDFSPALNVITGLNASGKTSLLEALSLLVQGKSFRTPRIDQLISHDQDGLMVFGRYRQGVHMFKTGLQREHKKTLVKVNGQAISKMTEIVGKLPLFILTPESHELLASGPKVRRQFLDWGVFHVEHRYLDHWQRFHRILRQRNSSLRQQSGKTTIQAWDAAFVEHAELVHASRSKYIETLTGLFYPFCHALLGLEVKIQYRPGWDDEIGLRTQLTTTLDQDIERGFTQLGPQRADLRFLADGKSVQNVFSRGQQKLLICALTLAQLSALQLDTVILVDDLPAELDPNKRQVLMESLRQSGAQVFVTATEGNLIKIDDWQDKKLFHVEHGKLQEVV